MKLFSPQLGVLSKEDKTLPIMLSTNIPSLSKHDRRPRMNKRGRPLAEELAVIVDARLIRAWEKVMTALILTGTITLVHDKAFKY